MTTSRYILKTPFRLPKFLGSGHFSLVPGLNYSKKSKLAYSQNLQVELPQLLHYKLNLEIITLISRMNYSFYYRPSVRASLTRFAGQAFIVLARSLLSTIVSGRQVARMCVTFFATNMHFTVKSKTYSIHVLNKVPVH